MFIEQEQCNTLGEFLKQLNDRQDLYEIRPFLFIVIAILGVFNSAVSEGSPAMIIMGQACGLILLFTSAKILKWRRDYRRQVM